MVTLKSKGGKKQTPAESNFELVKAGFKFLVIIGVMVGLIFGINYLFDKNSGTDETAAECAPIIQNSVFTTGDPLMDSRILYAIATDESPDREYSGEIVTHIWENKNFNFSNPDVKAHWDKSVQSVTEVTQEKAEPILSITSDGVIIPYGSSPETASIDWTFVPLNSIPAQRSNFLMVSSRGEEQTSTPVPTVLLSLNGGTTVPSPTLGNDAKIEAVDHKKVCEPNEEG